MDIFDGAPDPYAILHYSYDPSEDFFQVGQTRYFDDVNEAKWPEAFEFTYAGVNSKQVRYFLTFLERETVGAYFCYYFVESESKLM